MHELRIIRLVLKKRLYVEESLPKASVNQKMFLIRVIIHCRDL